jgi:hypothetical protein
LIVNIGIVASSAVTNNELIAALQFIARYKPLLLSADMALRKDRPKNATPESDLDWIQGAGSITTLFGRLTYLLRKPDGEEDSSKIPWILVDNSDRPDDLTNTIFVLPRDQQDLPNLGMNPEIEQPMHELDACRILERSFTNQLTKQQQVEDLARILDGTRVLQNPIKTSSVQAAVKIIERKWDSLWNDLSYSYFSVHIAMKRASMALLVLKILHPKQRITLGNLIFQLGGRHFRHPPIFIENRLIRMAWENLCTSKHLFSENWLMEIPFTELREASSSRAVRRLLSQSSIREDYTLQLLFCKAAIALTQNAILRIPGLQNPSADSSIQFLLDYSPAESVETSPVAYHQNQEEKENSIPTTETPIERTSTPVEQKPDVNQFLEKWNKATRRPIKIKAVTHTTEPIVIDISQDEELPESDPSGDSQQFHAETSTSRNTDDSISFSEKANLTANRVNGRHFMSILQADMEFHGEENQPGSSFSETALLTIDSMEKVIENHRENGLLDLLNPDNHVLSGVLEEEHHKWMTLPIRESGPPKDNLITNFLNLKARWKLANEIIQCVTMTAEFASQFSARVKVLEELFNRIESSGLTTTLDLNDDFTTQYPITNFMPSPQNEMNRQKLRATLYRQSISVMTTGFTQIASAIRTSIEKAITDSRQILKRQNYDLRSLTFVQSVSQ